MIDLYKFTKIEEAVPANGKLVLVTDGNQEFVVAKIRGSRDKEWHISIKGVASCFVELDRYPFWIDLEPDISNMFDIRSVQRLVEYCGFIQFRLKSINYQSKTVSIIVFHIIDSDMCKKLSEIVDEWTIDAIKEKDAPAFIIKVKLK